MNPIFQVESLLTKYPFGATRYAWYPTPDRFATDFGAGELRKAHFRRRSASAPRPLALVVNCAAANGSSNAYFAHVAQEAELRSRFLSGREEIAQLHVAAGDTRELPARSLEALLEGLESSFLLPPRENRSIEIPARADKLPQDLAALGFRRVTVTARGSESIALAVEAVLETIEQTRRAGVESVSAEIKYGAPGFATAGFAAAIDRIVQARPERIALSEHWRPGRTDARLDHRARASILAHAIERLSQAGYAYAGLDVFELPETAVRPLEVPGRTASRPATALYPLHSRSDVLGLGAAAVSALGDCYSQNAYRPEEYVAPLRENELPVVRGYRLTADDLLRREIIHSLECGFAIAFSAIEHKYSIEFPRYFARELDRLDEMQSDGLVELYGDAIEVTPQGRPLVRAVSALFDRYLMRRALSDIGVGGGV